MIGIGNILNNRVLFTAEELREHLQNGGNPPHLIFDQAILACRILNLAKGEFAITLQIQGIGLDDLAGAEVRVEYTADHFKSMNIKIKMGWQHVIRGANLDQPIYLTVLSIPEDALNRESLKDKLRNMNTTFRAQKVRRGGNMDLQVATLHLQRMSDGFQLYVQAKDHSLQTQLTGLILHVSCYATNGQQASVDVELDDEGYTGKITGVSQEHPISITFA